MEVNCGISMEEKLIKFHRNLITTILGLFDFSRNIFSRMCEPELLEISRNVQIGRKFLYFVKYVCKHG